MLAVAGIAVIAIGVIKGALIAIVIGVLVIVYALIRFLIGAR